MWPPITDKMLAQGSPSKGAGTKKTASLKLKGLSPELLGAFASRGKQVKDAGVRQPDAHTGVLSLEKWFLHVSVLFCIIRAIFCKIE